MRLLAKSTPVCSTCGLPIAAAGGALTRRCMQVIISRVLAHGSGRLVVKCTELRAQIHNSKVLGVGPMLPKATITECTGEETRFTQRQKGTKTKGRPPFCQLQCNAHRGTSACCAPLAQCPVIPPVSHDLVIFRHFAGPAPLGGDRYNYIQSKYRQNV